MGDLGVNADSRFSTADIVASGARWARFPLRFSEDPGPWLVQAATRGLQTIMVLDSHPDSLGDDEGLWPERLAMAWRQYGSSVTVVQAFNEPDADPNSPSSWVMDRERLARGMRLVAEVMPGARRWGPGLCSGQPSWGEGLPWETVECASLHLYGQRPAPDWPDPNWGFGFVGDLIDRYRDTLKVPLVVTEIGLNTAEVSEDLQAEYCGRMMAYLGNRDDLMAALWFCFSDLQV